MLSGYGEFKFGNQNLWSIKWDIGFCISLIYFNFNDMEVSKRKVFFVKFR